MTDILHTGDRVLVRFADHGRFTEATGTVRGYCIAGHPDYPIAHDVFVLLDGRDQEITARRESVERLIVPAVRPKLHLLPRVRAFLRLATVGGERVPS